MTLSKLKQERKNEMVKEYDKQFEIRKKSAFVKFTTVERPVRTTNQTIRKNKSEVKLDTDLTAFNSKKPQYSNVKTQKQLDRLRRQLSIQHNVNHTNPRFIKSVERLESRENAILRVPDTKKDKNITKRRRNSDKNKEILKKKNFFEDIKKNIGYSIAQRDRFKRDIEKLAYATVEISDIPVDPFKSNRVIKSTSMSKIVYNLPTSPHQVDIKPYKGEFKKSPMEQSNFRSKQYQSKDAKRDLFSKEATMLNSDSKPLFSSFSQTGYIDTQCRLKIEGPNRLDIKKLFKKQHSKIKTYNWQKLYIAKKKRNEQLFHQSSKFEEDTNKVMFRTVVAKGIKTGSFSQR